MINHIDEHNTGILDFPTFYTLVKKKIDRELDPENHFKNAFRAFSKDSGGWFAIDDRRLDGDIFNVMSYNLDREKKRAMTYRVRPCS